MEKESKEKKIDDPQKERRNRITEDIRVLREWTNGGSGIPLNLITSELFSDIASASPEAFRVFQKYAEVNSRLDARRLELMTEFPEIWTWPIENERNWLLVQANLGKGQEALIALKEMYANGTAGLKSKEGIGFGKR